MSPKNCGACGHDCQSGSCSLSLCAQETVVGGDNQIGPGGAAPGYPVYLASDATELYWADAFTAIKSRGLDGGAVAWSPLPNVGGTQEVLSFAVGTSSVFFTTAEGTPRFHSHVFRVARSAIGTSPVTSDELATGADVGHLLDSVRADSTAVFWGMRDAVGPTFGAIETSPPDAPAGSATVAEDKQRPHALAITSKSLVWIDRAADVSKTMGGAVFVDTRPQSVLVLLGAGIIPFDLLAVGPDAYFPWINGSQTSIRRATLDGKTTTDIVPNVALSGDVLWTDGTTLVWSTVDSPATNITLWVCTVPACTDPLAVAAVPVGAVTKIGAITLGLSVTIAGDWLYWAEPNTHRIQRVSLRRQA
jgi:hypothetical protein